MLGSDVLIVTIDDARKFITMVQDGWGREKIERLQRLGCFDAVERLRDSVREYDRREDAR